MNNGWIDCRSKKGLRRCSKWVTSNRTLAWVSRPMHHVGVSVSIFCVKYHYIQILDSTRNKNPVPVQSLIRHSRRFRRPRWTTCTRATRCSTTRERENRTWTISSQQILEPVFVPILMFNLCVLRFGLNKYLIVYVSFLPLIFFSSFAGMVNNNALLLCNWNCRRKNTN